MEVGLPSVVLSIHGGKNFQPKSFQRTFTTEGPTAGKPFSLPQRYLFAIKQYLAEISSGGHQQFYSTDAGLVWEDALKGFQEIGLNECSDILQESANLLGGAPSKKRRRQQEQLETLKPDFSDLDSKVSRIAKTLDPVLMDYIKKNRIHFYFDSTFHRPKQLLIYIRPWKIGRQKAPNCT